VSQVGHDPKRIDSAAGRGAGTRLTDDGRPQAAVVSAEGGCGPSDRHALPASCWGLSAARWRRSSPSCGVCPEIRSAKEVSSV